MRNLHCVNASFGRRTVVHKHIQHIKTHISQAKLACCHRPNKTLHHPLTRPSSASACRVRIVFKWNFVFLGLFRRSASDVPTATAPQLPPAECSTEAFKSALSATYKTSSAHAHAQGLAHAPRHDTLYVPVAVFLPSWYRHCSRAESAALGCC